MSEKIKITIELEYDLEDYYQDFNYYNLSTEDIVDDIEEMVYDDLTDLMRGDRLKFWSTATRTL